MQVVFEPIVIIGGDLVECQRPEEIPTRTHAADRIMTILETGL